MKTPHTRLVVSPFSGFYNTPHSAAIDDAITSMFSARATGCTPNAGLEMAVFRACDYRMVYTSYAQAYAEVLAEALHIPSLKFESLNSPMEYNFTTDRIFCTITQGDLLVICKAVDKAKFLAHAKAQFTSRDGFSSFYSPDVAQWGHSKTWDHNQLACLLEVYADELLGTGVGGFSSWEQYDLTDGLRGNGYIDNWIHEATPGIDRLYKIHDYLETRAARV